MEGNVTNDRLPVFVKIYPPGQVLVLTNQSVRLLLPVLYKLITSLQRRCRNKN